MCNFNFSFGYKAKHNLLLHSSRFFITEQECSSNLYGEHDTKKHMTFEQFREPIWQRQF